MDVDTGNAAGRLIDLRDVTVLTEGATLLERVNWRVRRGERWVVVGPNGAGKSTLLRVASTYRFPSRGQAWILGHRLGRVDVWKLRPRIGYTSAELERMLDGRMTAHDAVITARRAMLVRWREQYSDADHERASLLLGQLGVASTEQRPVATLSEGERRRVHIARALMARPELLLLDEPAAGLDIGGREHLVTVLARLAADDDVPGIVFVTHHVEEIPPGFTHAALLAAGKIVAGGPLSDTLTAEHLSHCFALELELDRSGDRYAARARSPAGLQS